MQVAKVQYLFSARRFILLLTLFTGWQQMLFAQTMLQTAAVKTTASSQPFTEDKPELSIGDVVPDVQFNMLNYTSATARLSDFRGKLVILDFWATWCTSCINRFPKMNDLQKKFGDQLQVVLVNTKTTGDNREKVEAFLTKWKKKYSDFNLPTAILDTIVNDYFPHRLIPHYVWIGPDGRVKAITSSSEVTEDHIRKILSGKDIDLSTKKDIDANRPLYLSEAITVEDLTHYSIFIKGKLEGLPGGNRLRRSGDIVRGRAMTNTPVLTMYRIAINQMRDDFKVTDKRMVLEVSDPSKLLYDKVKTDKDAWYKENLYTYDLIVPVSEAGKLYQYMLDDLNRYSGYFGRVEKRTVKYLALVSVSTGNNIKLQTAGGKRENKLYDKEKPYMKNAPIASLADFLDGADFTSLPVIDETGYKGNIDIQLPPNWNTLVELKKSLQPYGLDLIEKENELDMFVLSEKTTINNQ